MGRRGTEMGIQWDCGTIGQGDNATERDGYTMELGHYCTRAEWDLGTIEGAHNRTGVHWTGVQWDRNTSGRGHNGTGALVDGGVMGLGHYWRGAQ